VAGILLICGALSVSIIKDHQKENAKELKK